MDEELGGDDYFGFGVDAGMGALRTSRPRRPSRHTGPGGWNRRHDRVEFDG